MFKPTPSEPVRFVPRIVLARKVRIPFEGEAGESDNDLNLAHLVLDFPALPVDPERYVGSQVDLHPINPNNGEFLAVLQISVLTDELVEAKNKAMARLKAKQWAQAQQMLPEEDQ